VDIPIQVGEKEGELELLDKRPFFIILSAVGICVVTFKHKLGLILRQILILCDRIQYVFSLLHHWSELNESDYKESQHYNHGQHSAFSCLIDFCVVVSEIDLASK
jgi:hypothetical protein